jgi:Mycothiol maleylpyruvate isomerase N-terminal domain
MGLSGDMSSPTSGASWLAALNASSERLIKTVRELPGEVLARPSFTGDWTIAQVLSHLGSAAEICTKLVRRGIEGDTTAPTAGDARPVWQRWDALSGHAQREAWLEADRLHRRLLDSLSPQQLESVHGGVGYTFGELGVVLEEFGAALAPVPLLSTVVAAAAILAGDQDEPKQALLPTLASGQTVATVILGAGLTVSAAPAAGAWTVSGTAGHVPDAAHAALFVVAAAVDGGPQEVLLAVDATAPGVAVRPLNGLDGTRQIAVVELADAPAALLGGGQDLLDRVRAAQLVATAMRPRHGQAGCLLRGDRAGSSAGASRQRTEHCWADDHPVRHGQAAGAVSATHAARRCRLGTGLLRARGRLRPARLAHDCAP